MDLCVAPPWLCLILRTCPLGRQPPALPQMCTALALLTQHPRYRGGAAPGQDLAARLPHGSRADWADGEARHRHGWAGRGAGCSAAALLLRRQACAGRAQTCMPPAVAFCTAHSCLPLPPNHLTAPWPPPQPLPPDASIPVHINNICERNYVGIQSGRRCVPTELGITLIR